jgi:hypothetical protein
MASPWPTDESSRFLIKGLFKDEVQLLQVDRMVFFWAGGFDLGGATLRSILIVLGASAVVSEGACHLVVRHSDPHAHAKELADFLCEEDNEDQFTVGEGTISPTELPSMLFSISVIGPHSSAYLSFDDSGVQDWAFTTLLPQLSDEDPSLFR